MEGLYVITCIFVTTSSTITICIIVASNAITTGCEMLEAFSPPQQFLPGSSQMKS